jgi:hypothetical protein
MKHLRAVVITLVIAVGVALGVEIVAGSSPAAAATGKWMWAYGAYTHVYNASHVVIGESEWENIYAYCQANNFGGVWGNQLYLWAYVPTATPSGYAIGWVDSRNVNNYNQSGIAGLSWCW